MAELAFILRPFGGFFLYTCLIMASSQVALHGAKALVQATVPLLRLEGAARPVSRVDVGLAAQQRSAVFQPAAYEIERTAPPQLPVDILAKKLDEAENVTLRRGPRVAGWLQRRRVVKKIVISKETPNDIIMRSLRAEL
jgi:hypothetical protein